MEEEKSLRELYDLFSRVARSLGYSSVHGKIIGVLLLEGREMSLQELAKATGYSSASISLSLDLLEVFGLVKKVRKSGDRKLYVKLEGDVLDVLRHAVLAKAKQNIASTLTELERYKSSKNVKIKRAANLLERELKRLRNYIDKLAEVELPKD